MKRDIRKSEILKAVFCALLFTPQTSGALTVTQLAHSNGFNPSPRVIQSIESAARVYHLNPLELTAIGILETGLGKYNRKHINVNGTVDQGVFQINTVNAVYCIEYNLQSPEGSSLCAAKLLSRIKNQHPTDKKALGRYHSNTPEHKAKYFRKLSQVIDRGTDK